MSDTTIIEGDLSPAAFLLSESGGLSSPVVDYHPRSVIAELFREAGAFDFFQAVALLDRFDPRRQPVGKAADPTRESVRLRAALGSVFPPAAIREALPPTSAAPQPEMTVALLGLTGPSGILPRHYTELLYRVEREAKGSEKRALRDWLDLFNHRLLALFYRGWDKHRFSSAFARREHEGREPDAFTTAVFSLAGLGLPQLRGRLQVTALTGDVLSRHEKPLAYVEDMALLRYSGLLAQRPRTAGNLRQLLRDYFGLPVDVEQFKGQWLVLESDQQSRLGSGSQRCIDPSNQLGRSAVAGTRVWDVQSKFRVRVGPLRYDQFVELLPDRAAEPERKSFFLLCHLVRLFAGPEFDIDVQLILRREDVRPCQLTSDRQHGPRLGWNTWVLNEPAQRDAADAHFDGVEVNRINATGAGWPQL